MCRYSLNISYKNGKDRTGNHERTERKKIPHWSAGRMFTGRRCRYYICIPGEETLDLMFAIKESEYSFIDTRHEQGVALIADVYGRADGAEQVYVCLHSITWLLPIW